MSVTLLYPSVWYYSVHALSLSVSNTKVLSALVHPVIRNLLHQLKDTSTTSTINLMVFWQRKCTYTHVCK